MVDTIIIDDTEETDVIVSEVGLQGVPGGDAAPPYVHTQSVPAATWSVSHELGYQPSSIRVTDSAGDEVDDFWIQNETADSFDLVFSGAFSGVARIK